MIQNVNLVSLSRFGDPNVWIFSFVMLMHDFFHFELLENDFRNEYEHEPIVGRARALTNNKYIQ